jgi:hypothetical protein
VVFLAQLTLSSVLIHGGLALPDYAMTEYAHTRPGWREANPIVPRSVSGRAALFVGKSVALGWIDSRLKGRRRTVLRVVVGAVSVGACVWNAHQLRSR